MKTVPNSVLVVLALAHEQILERHGDFQEGPEVDRFPPKLARLLRDLQSPPRTFGKETFDAAALDVGESTWEEYVDDLDRILDAIHDYPEWREYVGAQRHRVLAFRKGARQIEAAIKQWRG